jgi:hypothetical protein
MGQLVKPARFCTICTHGTVTALMFLVWLVTYDAVSI